MDPKDVQRITLTVNQRTFALYVLREEEPFFRAGVERLKGKHADYAKHYKLVNDSDQAQSFCMAAIDIAANNERLRHERDARDMIGRIRSLSTTIQSALEGD